MTEAVFESSSSPTTSINYRKLRSDMLIRRTGRLAFALVPWIAYLFLWIPILVLILFSFNDSRMSAVWRGFTFHWYQGLLAGQFGDQPNFTTANLLDALQRSLFVGAVSTAIATVLGTMVALGLDRYRVRGKRLIEMLMYLPVVIPEITMGLSLLIYFSSGFNVLRQWFGVQWTLSLWTVIIGHVVFSLPFVAIAVRARLSGMTRSLEEAARDLGANEWRTFQRITLPLLMPGILAGALLAFTLSLDDFVITFFTQGPGTTTLPLFVYGMIKFQVTPDINAISTLMVLASIALVTCSLLIQRNRT